LLLAQATYYAATGVWPLVSMRTFEAVTGPKTDKWLVKTVGALVLAEAAALAVGTRRESPSTETITLAVACAVAFTAIDVTYVLLGRISSIYLADAAVEVALAAGIAFGE
jgi:hypothetical protein